MANLFVFSVVVMAVVIAVLSKYTFVDKSVKITNESKMFLLNSAFNAHDTEKIISMMTEDCVFVNAVGVVYEGKASIKKVFDDTFTMFPDSAWTSRNHDYFFGDNRGLSEWTFRGTRSTDNVIVHADGIDLFVFNELGLISRKDAYRKST